MKFKKIDQYTVRCVLTEDDMIENDIELEDFFHNREKVHNLLEVIMDKAKNEVGYELNEDVLSMQIMPLPKNGLAITISGKNDSDVIDIMGKVNELASMSEDDLEDSDKVKDEDSNDDNSLLRDTESLNNLGLIETQKLVKKAAEKDDSAIPKDGIKIFRFTSLNEVEAFCRTMQHPKYVLSHLFKNNSQNCFYLVIEQGRFTIKTFNMVCGMAVEFGELISHQSLSMVFIREHYELYISKNAIATMRKIASVN